MNPSEPNQQVHIEALLAGLNFPLLSLFIKKISMNIKITQLTESGSESKIRDHHLTCDRPVEKGGGNEGPMGGEYFLMGLGGCFTSNLLAAIKCRSAEVSNVELDVNATLAENPARFSKIEVEVSAQ